MPDRWLTYPVQFKGGLVTNMSPLQQGIEAPGTATALRNYEPAVSGGYRRLKGFSKWDDTELSNTGVVRGVFYYKDNVYAVRGDGLFTSAGSGWTEITDNATYSSSGITIGGTDGKVRFTKFDNGVGEVMILVDGTGKPYK